MPAFEIPLIPAAQTFKIALSGTFYRFTFRWNDPANCWMMDFADANNVPLAQGIPLIPGADLLQQYAYLGLPGRLVVQCDNDNTAVPGYADLGISGHLYYVTAA